jgi:hypothetical protein
MFPFPSKFRGCQCGVAVALFPDARTKLTAMGGRGTGRRERERQ